MAIKLARNSSSTTLLEDLMIVILTRLPVKSLLRMKSVSKTWYNLINTPYFVTMHANLANKDKLIICASVEDDDEYTHTLSFLSNYQPIVSLSPDLKLPTKRRGRCDIVGSCNGIVCFLNDGIFLCNPATREFKQLHPTYYHPIIRGLESCGQMIRSIGFCSSSIYDLKVIVIYDLYHREDRFRLGMRTVTRAELYNLSSNTWRQIDYVGNNNIRMDHRNNFCENSCHWLGTYEAHYDVILCFDMHTESFKKPINYRKVGIHVDLNVFKEYLSLVTAYSCWSSETQCIGIWIMKEYGVEDSWTKLSSFGPFSAYICCLLSFWMDDHALLLNESDGVYPYDHKLVSCNLDKGYVDFLEVDRPELLKDVVVHKDTLISLK